MDSITPKFGDFFKKPSAYYLAAGIDLIQPVLRLSHLVQDFVFVTSAPPGPDFDEGFRNALANLNEELPGVLQIAQSGELPMSFLGLGDTPEERRIPFYEPYGNTFITHYIRNLSKNRERRPHIYAYILTLQFPGGAQKTIRALHLVGFEGIATYHHLFLSGSKERRIPAVFISIESGFWERRSRMMDLMEICHFHNSRLPPCLWIRGSWKLGVRFTSGMYYTTPVGEYAGWLGSLGVKIPQVTHPRQSKSMVQAFGFDALWSDYEQERQMNVPEKRLSITLKRGLVKNADKRKFDITPLNTLKIRQESTSSPEARHISENSERRKYVPCSHPQICYKLLFSEQLELIRMHYAVMAAKGNISSWRRQAIPVGFEAEAFEALERFRETFVPVNDVPLHIEFVYKNLLDFTEELPYISDEYA
jgi:hypothetical protein